MLRLAIFSLLLAALVQSAPAAEKNERMLSHDVYFTLQEDSPQNRGKLVAACQKYLAGHPGTVWFAAGPIADELNRDVNDQAFDVALHVVFLNKQAHDQYQTAERHLKFIEENSSLWASVRVFDSYLDASSHEGVAEAGMTGKNAK